jgi:rSAM/selenodomain-associated transferase 2
LKKLVVSIVMPVYNEGKIIEKAISGLIRETGVEVIVVDGGSTDDTVLCLKNYPVNVISSAKNRATQMNAGAREAKGDVLLFLHADCILEEGAISAIRESVSSGLVGGCLRHIIDSPGMIYRMIEATGDIRAKLSKIFYGDQAIFVKKDVFSKLGGYDNVSLFDDVLFSKKLRRAGKTRVLNKKVYASSRRWQKQGIIKATLVNWLVSVGFMAGISPRVLKKVYCDIR